MRPRLANAPKGEGELGREFYIKKLWMVGGDKKRTGDQIPEISSPRLTQWHPVPVANGLNLRTCAATYNRKIQ